MSNNVDRGPRGPNVQGNLPEKALHRSRRKLPEYLEPPQVEALLGAAQNGEHRLAMLVQWRAGLRVSEVLGLELKDLRFESDPPMLAIRHGKGDKARMVPAHPELVEAVQVAMRYRRYQRFPRVIEAKNPATLWRWVKTAQRQAVKAGKLEKDLTVRTHTLRHSAARHWLANGVPINVVSQWLGHSSLQTTLIYLQLMPDPMGYMDRVP